MKKVAGADAASFELYKEGDSTLESLNYARDKNFVFLDDKKINDADVSTFRVLTLGYSSDSEHVFYKTSIIKDADPASFKTYQHGYGDADAEDAKKKYLAGKKVVVE